MNNGTGRVWAVNAEGGDEGRPNGVGPVIIENIDKLGGSLPDPSGASQGDVLTVGASGPEWAAPSGGNYSAGNGIDISAAGVISAKVGAGLTIADYSQSSHVSETVTVAGRQSFGPNYTYEYLAPCTADIVNAINTDSANFTTAKDFYGDGGTRGNITGCYAAILSKTGNYAPNVANRLVLGSVAYVDTTQDPEATGTESVKVTSGTVATFSMSNYDSVSSTITLADVLADPAGYVLALVAYDAGHTRWRYCNFGIQAASTTTGSIVYDSVYSVEDAITVTNPVPASTVSDAGKILTVNSSGAPAWGMLGSVTSIQQVSALPATPNANTLYLIPEA